MTAFFTLNTLLIFSLILFALIIALTLYARKINSRLNQSIKLINDLYKLNQRQASTITELLGDTETIQLGDTEDTANTESPLVSALVLQASDKVKTTMASDVEAITKTSISTAMVKIIEPINELAKRVVSLENKTELLQREDPELKRYSRASQLVKEGASIEDIMEASQLPRAEVEVLVGLQRPDKTTD